MARFDSLAGLVRSPQWKQKLAGEALRMSPTDNLSVHTIHNPVCILKGDITELGVDAIVNAANSSLLGGGGVDGAIHCKAGKELLQECRGLGGCLTGEAKITAGYNLPAHHVIHTVGPIVRGREQPEQLARCYTSSLELASQKQLRSIAFPCISTGVYGYPQEAAAHVALQAVKTWLEANSNRMDLVVFCVFLPKDYIIYSDLLLQYFPVK
ncbi:hypothetical protein BASA50_011400 [Batrachochytrium salamandrivorans]|uniref:Macro domain-containing protein n=1 Tax=Batrachochytrium salamandrivorans TaxID=1357716 RepID=A0ABQ8EVN5_9FUNG|nr:hypothetical protein BASA60_007770 [Batrachochytrium salamandrivorans]KAH6587398.1 hypothetical protein BASA50_011400 [Batrachochytrium salamandrivorans]